MVCLAAVGCGGEDPTTTVRAEPQKLLPPIEAGEGPKQGQGAGPSSPGTAPSSSSERALSTAAFIRQADAVCKSFNLNIRSAATVSEAYETYERGIATVSGLEPSPEIAPQWRRYLAALEDQFRFQKRGDTAGRDRARDRKAEAARGIGLSECGTG